MASALLVYERLEAHGGEFTTGHLGSTYVNNRVYTVVCPQCSAVVGANCADPTNGTRYTPHLARIVEFRGGEDAHNKFWSDDVYPTLQAAWDEADRLLAEKERLAKAAMKRSGRLHPAGAKR